MKPSSIPFVWRPPARKGAAQKRQRCVDSDSELKASTSTVSTWRNPRRICCWARRSFGSVGRETAGRLYRLFRLFRLTCRLMCFVGLRSIFQTCFGKTDEKKRRKSQLQFTESSHRDPTQLGGPVCLLPRLGHVCLRLGAPKPQVEALT